MNSTEDDAKLAAAAAMALAKLQAAVTTSWVIHTLAICFVIFPLLVLHTWQTVKLRGFKTDTQHVRKTLFGSTILASVVYIGSLCRLAVDWRQNESGCFYFNSFLVWLFVVFKQVLLVFLYSRAKLVHDALRLRGWRIVLLRRIVLFGATAGVALGFYWAQFVVIHGKAEQQLGVCVLYTTLPIEMVVFASCDALLSMSMMLLFIVPLSKHLETMLRAAAPPSPPPNHSAASSSPPPYSAATAALRLPSSWSSFSAPPSPPPPSSSSKHPHLQEPPSSPSPTITKIKSPGFNNNNNSKNKAVWDMARSNMWASSISISLGLMSLTASAVIFSVTPFGDPLYDYMLEWAFAPPGIECAITLVIVHSLSSAWVPFRLPSDATQNSAAAEQFRTLCCKVCLVGGKGGGSSSRGAGVDGGEVTQMKSPERTAIQSIGGGSSSMSPIASPPPPPLAQ